MTETSSHLLEEDDAVFGHLELCVNGVTGGHGEGDIVDGFSCFFQSFGVVRCSILINKLICPFTESCKLRLRLLLRKRDLYLKESDDRHLVVGNQRLCLGNLVQGGDGGPGPLLQPVDDVICLPAGCNSKTKT